MKKIIKSTGTPDISWYVGNDGSISNCYSTGAVSGTNYVGGVAGQIYSGVRVSNCAALNPSVKGAGANVGRVVSIKSYGVTLSNNAAFDGIINNDGNTTWSGSGATNINGADITAAQIAADGTIGSRFITKNGWTTANGKMPILTGLDGQSDVIPAHLQPSLGGTVSIGLNATTGVETHGRASLQCASLHCSSLHCSSLQSKSEAVQHPQHGALNEYENECITINKI